MSYSYHFKFVRDPTAHPSTTVRVCSYSASVDVVIRVPDMSLADSTLDTTHTILAGLDTPIESVTWEQKRFGDDDRITAQLWVGQFMTGITARAQTPLSFNTSAREFVPAGVSAQLSTMVPTSQTSLMPTSKSYTSLPQTVSLKPCASRAPVAGESERMRRIIDDPCCWSPEVFGRVASRIASGAHPRLEMTTFAGAKRLRNYVNNITGAELNLEQIESICNWVCINRDWLCVQP
jgi:hypothetical protein